MSDSDALAMYIGFRAAPGRYDDLRRELLAIVGPTRAEDGCLQYDLHEDREDPEVLAFYEVWRDAAAHAAHDTTAHIEHIRSVLPGLTVGGHTVIRMRPIEP